MKIPTTRLTTTLSMVAVCFSLALSFNSPLRADQDNSANSGGRRDEQGSESKSGEKPPAVFKFIHPKVKGQGRVIHLPKAVEQPRSGSKICVDITSGGSPEKMNSAIQKVARFVNIYAGAGRQPAGVKITVVLHGDATLCALDSKSYASKFQTEQNPNLALIKSLRTYGVEFVVCGQSLASKGFSAENVTSDVAVAVSALTALVNRQMDGYAYVPLLK